jgi:hypothetical protein
VAVIEERTDSAARLLGAQVARARQGAHLSERELAERLGVSLWDVERFEAGTLDSTPQIERIAEITEMPVHWFHRRAAPARAHPTVIEPAVDGPLAPGAPRASLSDSWARGLVLAVVAGLVLIRFFSEVVSILPHAVNFADVPMFAVLLVATALVPAPPDRRPLGLLAPGVAFMALCAISVVANLERVAVGPTLLFVYGFLAPFVVLWAVYRLWAPGHALSLSKLLVALGLVQLVVVGTIELPRFISRHNPDDISGTFGQNPYQLVFFLLVITALLAGIFTFEARRRVAPWVPLLLTAVFAVIFLAQYRSLLLTTALTVLALGITLARGRRRGALLGTVAVVVLIGALSFTAQYFPVLKLGSTVGEIQKDPTYYARQRAKLLGDIGKLYGDDARYTITGTGPGTYSSRAWKTFAAFKSASDSNSAGPYIAKLAGGQVYRTDVADKYVVPRLENAQTISGSQAVTLPLSSWLSLLAELGVLGLLLALALYGRVLLGTIRRAGAAMRRGTPGDPVPALLLAGGTGLFVLLQMAFLENWLEVARLTFVTMAIVGVAWKEFDSRPAEADGA